MINSSKIFIKTNLTGIVFVATTIEMAKTKKPITKLPFCGEIELNGINLSVARKFFSICMTRKDNEKILKERLLKEGFYLYNTHFKKSKFKR
jgi:hypothetical protein